MQGSELKSDLSVWYQNFKKKASRKLYSYLEFLYYFKPRLLLCFLFGVLGGFGMTPFNILPFFVISIISIIRLCDFSQSLKDVFFVGVSYFYGFALVVFYWISFSFLADSSLNILFPIVFFIAPLVFAIPSALMFLIYKEVSYYTDAVERVVFFAVIWCIFEYIRSFYLSFPWALTGYTMMFSNAIFQFSSVIGVFGFSVFTMLLASSFQLIFLDGDGYKYYGYLKYIFILITTMLLMFLYGLFVLKSTKTEYGDSTLILRIVQAGIKPSTEKSSDERWNIITRHRNITTSDGFDNVTHIIWPESSIEFSLYQNEWAVNYIKEFLHEKQILIAGSLRIEENTKTGLLAELINDNVDDIKIYNTMSMIDGLGRQTYYDKHYLVPFGEFIPFRSFIPFLKSITGGGIDFASGSKIRVYKLLQTPPFIPLICYESGASGHLPMYSSIIQKDENGNERIKKERAKWIINITNDGWFGYTSGPFQHFKMSIARAIEYGVPVVRAANTGISAVIDPQGRVIKQLKLNDIGFIDSPLPNASKNQTIFSIVGNIPSILLVVFVFLSIFTHYLINKYYKKIIPATTQIFNLLDKASGRQRDKRGD